MYHRACRSLYIHGRPGTTASPRRNAGGRWRPIVSRSSHRAWRGNGAAWQRPARRTPAPAPGRTHSRSHNRSSEGRLRAIDQGQPRKALTQSPSWKGRSGCAGPPPGETSFALLDQGTASLRRTAGPCDNAKAKPGVASRRTLLPYRCSRPTFTAPTLVPRSNCTTMKMQARGRLRPTAPCLVRTKLPRLLSPLVIAGPLVAVSARRKR